MTQRERAAHSAPPLPSFSAQTLVRTVACSSDRRCLRLRAGQTNRFVALETARDADTPVGLGLQECLVVGLVLRGVVDREAS
jgi:hypothetical protein